MEQPETVGNYVLYRNKELGQGAFGRVFLGSCRDKPTQMVAIKRIPRPSFFTKEEEILRQIKNISYQMDSIKSREHILLLLDVEKTREFVYLIMEYCNGGDLDSLLPPRGRTLSEDIIRVFAKQIISVLLALKERGIVHRDLKPANILITYKETCLQGPLSKLSPEALNSAVFSGAVKLKVADFGLARILPKNAAATLCGTPCYMAPEVLLEQPYSAKADLWSLGIILYQCYTGKLPFSAETGLKKLYKNNQNIRLPLPSHTPPTLTRLLQHLLRAANERTELEDLLKQDFFRAPDAVEPKLAGAINQLIKGLGTPYVREPERPQALFKSGHWYVTGGFNSESQEKMFAYNPAQRFWSILPDLPWERHSHGVYQIDNHLTFVGGRKNGISSDHIDQYDLLCNKWLATSATKLPNKSLWFELTCDKPYAYALVNATTICRAAKRSGTFEKFATLPTEKFSPSMGFSVKLNAVLTGGGAGAKTIHKIDCATRQCSVVGEMADFRHRFASTFVGDDWYLAGGEREAPTNQVEIFNVCTGKVRQSLSITVRSGSRGLTLDNNIVCVLGGDSGGYSKPKYLSSVEAFDVREGKWSKGNLVSNMPSKNCRFGLTVLQ